MKIGPFEILETISGGGSGVVYKAREERLGRVVALKQLSKQVQDGDRASARFRREAQIMASIRSEHVVTLYSYQVIDGKPLLEMECLEHGSVADLLEAGPHSIDKVLTILEHVLLGLHALHAAGVIHRDVKPGNILQDERGRFKLADFGISAIESGAKPTLEAATIRYLAPETIADNPTCDARSDLYAVGMVGYELLLGHQGFQQAFPDLMPAAAFASKWLRWLKETNKEATAVHVLRPDVQVPASQLIARLMSKDPELRYRSAEAALEALRLLSPRTAVERRPPRAHAPHPEPVASAFASASAWELVAQVERNGDVEATLSFTRSPVLIGSSPKCDLVLSDPYVSAEHARVIVSRSQITLQDQSRNGSFVNGVQVKHAQLGTAGHVFIPPYRLALSLRMTGVPRETLLGTPRDSDGPAARHHEAGTIHFSPVPHGGESATLRIVKGPPEMVGATFPLTADVLVIGRANLAQIRVDTTTVSRRHVELRRQPDRRWVAVDLNSANGIAINGRRVASSVLAPGDLLDVGPEVVFEYSAPAGS